ncbi:hypothetical protein D9M70_375300 [compost metagenome]
MFAPRTRPMYWLAIPRWNGPLPGRGSPAAVQLASPLVRKNRRPRLMDGPRFELSAAPGDATALLSKLNAAFPPCNWPTR